MRNKILLLGSGELGKELVIAMQRLGQYVIAVDNYKNAPAMQLAHEYEVINMLDGAELDRIVKKHQPDYIVPEVESIRTERFYDYEKQGYNVIPSAKAANFTMNRKSIRDLAAVDLGVKTAKYKYATSFEELKKGVKFTGIPCVVKPLMSSSGKGQSVIKTESDIEKAWKAADKVGNADLEDLLGGLRSDDVSERYWAIIGLRNHAFADENMHQKIVDYLDDVSPSVRIETAGWLAHFAKYRRLALRRLVKDLSHEDWAVALRACRTIELLGEKAKSVLPVMQKLYKKTRHTPGDNNFFVAFSSGAFLDKLGEKTDPWDFTPGAGSFMPAVKKKKKE